MLASQKYIDVLKGKSLRTNLSTTEDALGSAELSLLQSVGLAALIFVLLLGCSGKRGACRSSSILFKEQQCFTKELQRSEQSTTSFFFWLLLRKL